MGRRPAHSALTDEESTYLHDFVRTGTHSARSIIRARILLMSAIPEPISVIAQTLNVCAATLQNLRTRYRTGGLSAALHDQPRSGQPRKVTAREEAYITTIACSAPPNGRGRWTVPLVTDRLVELSRVDVSREAVRRALKKVTSNRGSAVNGALGA